MLMHLSLDILMSINKDWISYSGWTDRPGKLCYNFFTSNELTKIINVPTGIAVCDSESSSFGFIYFF